MFMCQSSLLVAWFISYFWYKEKNEVARMFWFLHLRLSHVSSCGLICISIFLHEAFPTKVKRCLNYWFLRSTEQFSGKGVVILLRLLLEQCLSAEDLSAKCQKAASNIWDNCSHRSHTAEVKILLKYIDPVFQDLALCSPCFKKNMIVTWVSTIQESSTGWDLPKLGSSSVERDLGVPVDSSVGVG